MSDALKIELTSEEWDAFSRGFEPEDEGALPPCCANISGLRDVILAIGDNGGHVDSLTFNDLRQAWEWVCESHDMNAWDWTILRNLIGQAGLTWPAPEKTEH